MAGEDSSGALGSKDNADGPQEDLVNNNSYVSLDAIPAYDGKAYVLSTIMSLFLRTAI